MADNFWKNKKVLVTGASGFVGQHLVNKLEDVDVFLGTIQLDSYVSCDMSFNGNICNYDDVNRAISRFQPEIVFHLAAQPIVDIAFDAPLDTFETNIRGTYNLLEVCSKVGKNIQHFIHFSTDKVYGETTNEAGSNEHDRLDGVAHPYNASKLCGDIIAQSYASFSPMPLSIIRSGNIYGEGDTHWERLIPYVCKMLVTGQPIELRSDGFLYRDYIYINDVIDALLLVGKQKHGNIYNLGSVNSWTVKEVVQMLREISGIEDKSTPVYKANTHMELKYQHMDYEKIRTTLGWFPKTDLYGGLMKTYAWHKEQYGND